MWLPQVCFVFMWKLVFQNVILYSLFSSLFWHKTRSQRRASHRSRIHKMSSNGGLTGVTVTDCWTLSVILSGSLTGILTGGLDPYFKVVSSCFSIIKRNSINGCIETYSFLTRWCHELSRKFLVWVPYRGWSWLSRDRLTGQINRDWSWQRPITTDLQVCSSISDFI